MITDLPEAIASRTQQPPFEELVTRVREDRQRLVRRTSILGACLVAATLLVLPGLGDDSADEQPTGPRPSTPAPTDGLAMGVPELLARPDVSVVQVAGSDEGGVAALWQGCSGDGTDCGYAVLTANGSELGSVVVDSTVLSPTTGGWLIHTPGGWRALGPDGWVSGVTTAGEDGVRPGDEAVETAGGLGLLRGDRLLLMPSSSGSPTQAYVTPQGRLLEVTATGDGSLRLRATRDGRSWTTLLSWPAGNGATQVRLAGHGRTVAAVTTGGPGDARAVERVEVSRDGGRTWTTARGIDFVDQVRDLSGLAVSQDGTVFLTTGSDGLIRVDADGNAQRTPVSPHDQAVFTTTYEVCVLTGGFGGGRLQCSEDDGTSWSQQRLPGRSLVSGGSRRP